MWNDFLLSTKHIQPETNRVINFFFLSEGEIEKVAPNGSVPDDISQFYQQLDKEDDDDEATDITANNAVAFEVDPDKIEVLHCHYVS